MAEAYDDDRAAPEQRDERSVRDKLAEIIGRLQRDVNDRIAKRRTTEERWIRDIQQYHGQYDEETLKKIKDAEGSELFINLTRSKTNSFAARLSDMLFPTDDRNWGIQPSPVPELTVQAERAAREAAKLQLQAVEAPEGDPVQAQAAEAETASADLQAVMEEAEQRANAMQAEIEDALKACRYNVAARDAIEDGARIGTGILKGPVIDGKSRRSWRSVERVETAPGEVSAQVYELTSVSDDSPAFWRVDPWMFYPEPAARRMEESESTFELHLMNRKELRKLAAKPGFDKDAIRRILADKPRQDEPYWIQDLRSITSTEVDRPKSLYWVWEFHGVLEGDDLRLLAEATGDTELLTDIGADGEIDPLAEFPVILWFCQDELLKLSVHPLDSQESLYSVFTPEEDTASIYGFGIPWMIRDSQSSLSAGWRAMMDNAGLASGPQIVINTKVVRPANDTWGLEPRKVWLREGGEPNVPAFEKYDISSNQNDLAGIVDLSKQLMDEESAISTIAQGDPGANAQQTAHGMSLLMNSVNVVFRRSVKRWDDDMTTPNIQRMYDWEMQFSPKDEIKGDYEVDARGTSVLLVREIQSQNLMTFIDRFVDHPRFSAYVRNEGVPALRKLVQTMMIPADDILMTDDEIERERARRAKEPTPPDPEVLRAEASLNAAQIQADARIQVAIIDRETQLMRLAQQNNVDLERIAADLEKVREQLDQKDRSMAAEVAMAERTGVSSGGAV